MQGVTIRMKLQGRPLERDLPWRLYNITIYCLIKLYQLKKYTFGSGLLLHQ